MGAECLGSEMMGIVNSMKSDMGTAVYWCPNTDPDPEGH